MVLRPRFRMQLKGSSSNICFSTRICFVYFSWPKSARRRVRNEQLSSACNTFWPTSRKTVFRVTEGISTLYIDPFGIRNKNCERPLLGVCRREPRTNACYGNYNFNVLTNRIKIPGRVVYITTLLVRKRLYCCSQSWAITCFKLNKKKSINSVCLFYKYHIIWRINCLAYSSVYIFNYEYSHSYSRIPKNPNNNDGGNDLGIKKKNETETKWVSLNNLV